MRRVHLWTTVLSVAIVLLSSFSLFGGKVLPNPLHTPDSSGVLGTYNTAGEIDINNPFFQSLGTNGRGCNTCHISSSAWSLKPADVDRKSTRLNSSHIPL